MYPGYSNQFPNGLTNNSQQGSSQLTSVIPTSSTSQFLQSNRETPLSNQIQQPIHVAVQQNQMQQQQFVQTQPVQLRPIPQQAKQPMNNQSKQLTIQQSIQQSIHQRIAQPLNNQNLNQHPMQNQVQHIIQQQSGQIPTQKSNSASNFPIPISQQGTLIHPSQPIRSMNPNQFLIPNFQIQHQISSTPSNQNLNNGLFQALPQQPSEPFPLDDDEFQVEGIADEREVKGKMQYLVQWLGFSDDENTWEDESNLSRYYQLINDFKLNGPKTRTQRRVKDFITGFITKDKIHYNVLYQNDEVATVTSLQARGSRYKQQLINFLEKEYPFPEKDRVIIPPKPPKSPSSSTDIPKSHSSAGLSEYEYEYTEEEEEVEIPGEDGENKIVKKRIKKKRRVIQVSSDEPGSFADGESREDPSSEANDEIRIQTQILQEDPIDNTNIDSLE